MGFAALLSSAVETFAKEVLNKDSSIKVSAHVDAAGWTYVSAMDKFPATRKRLMWD